jgi:hypothetical protein
MKIMRSERLVALAVVFACAFVLQACKRSEEGEGQGGEGRGGNVETRVPVKTSLPPGEDPSQARPLTFLEFITIPEPPGVAKNDPRYDKARIPAFPNPLNVKEGDIVKVAGYLHIITLMGDDDYNMRVSASPDSADNYFTIEVPDDDDVADKKLRPLVEAARKFLEKQVLDGKEPSRQGSTPAKAPYVEITGQLYFSDNHVGDPVTPDRQGLHRATSWQIHPGLIINFAQAPAMPTY